MKSVPLHHSRRRRNRVRPLLVLAAVLAVVALLAAGLAMLPALFGGDGDEPVSSAPADASTDALSSSPGGEGDLTTTTTTTTGAATAGTKAPTLDESGMLQFDPAGHYVQPSGTVWNLLLVNDWNAMDAGYEAGVTFTPAGNNQQVDSRVLEALNAMLEAGRAYGIGVQSGYRSAENQGILYWRQVQKYRDAGMEEVAAQTAAGQVVKRPGFSEHNTGLAVDLGGSGNFRLEQDFEDTPAFAWLIENCADYGFILRFPEGKEAITGVIYEPWHYRYVGVEAATAIMENGLCLEEYLAQKGL